MKSLNVGSAVLAGVVGTVAMTALMYAAPLMGLPPMDLLLALGSLLPIGISPYLVGGLMHLATGVILALLYAVVFERLLPGPQWLRGAAFSLAPWIFAITLMAPAMAWLQGMVSPAEARAMANQEEAWKPANPCSPRAAAQVANPCAIRRNAGTAVKPANPCAATASEGTEAASPWVLRMMSLMAHLLYGGIVGLVYQRRA
ncbi:MAG: hypothetical protein HYU41_14930 [Candidatus Rokubacteria bacterium]|nr:hypothetical protein [Candidatus Rokubacteria bacterium]